MKTPTKEQLRIAIYETPEKVIEGGYGDFYNTLERSEAIQRMYKGFYRAKDNGAYTVKEMLAAALDELLKP